MENQFIFESPAKGVTVCSCPTDRFKTGILAVHLVVPLAGNVAEQAILPYLLASSCAAYPDLLSMNRRLAGLYGAELTPSVSKLGEHLVLRLSMTQIGDRFAFDGDRISVDCARLLFEALFHPNVENGAFRAEDVEREKRVMQERMEAQKNNKRTYALRRAQELMCEGEAYALSALGREEDLVALTSEQLYKSWKRVLREATYQLHIVGDLQRDAVVELFTDYLAEVSDRAPVLSETEVLPSAETVKRAEETEDISQGKLVLGFRCGMTAPNDNYAAIRTMVDLFGGGTYSRLFMNVREKQSLCYYCSARLLGTKGIVFVQSGIETKNAEKAEAEILRQLQEMQEGNVSEEDLEKSKKSMEDTFLSVFDSPEDLDGWVYSQLADGTFETPEELVEELKAVTIDQVVDAAKHMTLDTVFLLKGTGAGDAGEEEYYG